MNNLNTEWHKVKRVAKKGLSSKYAGYYDKVIVFLSPRNKGNGKKQVFILLTDAAMKAIGNPPFVDVEVNKTKDAFRIIPGYAVKATKYKNARMTTISDSPAIEELGLSNIGETFALRTYVERGTIVCDCRTFDKIIK